MINLKELYEAGHRQFMFSDGVVREVVGVHPLSRNLLFEMPNGDELYFTPKGENNLGRKDHPVVVGPEDRQGPDNVNLQTHDGKWWLEVPLSATVHDITKAWEVLNNV